jgi:hypothetical protein
MHTVQYEQSQLLYFMPLTLLPYAPFIYVFVCVCICINIYIHV